jgi:hypothetical protein
MLDSASRISSLETELSAMDKAFRTEIAKLQNQALDQAESQLLHGNMLNEILTTLKQLNTTTDKPVVPPDKSEAANCWPGLTPIQICPRIVVGVQRTILGNHTRRIYMSDRLVM